MESHFDKEKREFVRVNCEVAVRYKFICRQRVDTEMISIYEGKTNNLGGGGLLLQGKVPKIDWVADLLLHKIIIGVNMWLPDSQEPVRALTRVAWIETIDEKTLQCSMGLMFREITTMDKDKVFRFVLKAQIPT